MCCVNDVSYFDTNLNVLPTILIKTLTLIEFDSN